MLTPAAPQGLAAHEPAALAQLITDHAADGIFLLDEQGRTTFANPAGEAMFGWPAADLLGRKLHDIVHHHRPDGSVYPMSECPLGQVFATGESLRLHQDVFFHRDGRQVQVACSNAAIVRDGAVVGSVLIVSDNSRRVEAERHKQLLLDELGHRVKNVLAVVQVLAEQSLSGPGLAEVRHVTSARIRALAEAQDLLVAGEGVAVPIGELVARALRPFGLVGRIEQSGPDLSLAPRLATHLSMAIHELGTNALKYGALSNDSGKIAINWDTTGDDGNAVLSFIWREQDGPQVTPPTRKGFGSKMIERILAAEFGGNAKMDFQPAGIVCTLTAPLQPKAG